MLCCLLKSNRGFTGQEQNLQKSFVLIIINGKFIPLITGSGTPSTYRLGIRDSFLRGKMGGGGVKLTIHLPSSAEVRNGCSSASTLPYVFMG